MSKSPKLEIHDLPLRTASDMDGARWFATLDGLPNPVWLDSGTTPVARARYDILTAAPLKMLELGSGQSRTNAANSDPGPLQAFEQARALLSPYRLDNASLNDLARNLPFIGGLAGFLSYDLGRALVMPASADPRRALLPDVPGLRLGCYLWALLLDRRQHKALLVFHPACPTDLKADIRARLADPPPKPERAFELLRPFSASTSHATYLSALRRIQDYIRAGDCYQVNFAQHFSAPYRGDPARAYLQLRSALPSPFSAYLAWEDSAILSLSPERFLQVRGRQLETRPIKGTASRGSDSADDQTRAQALYNSAKDRAENLMIVDLLRNDLGRSCEPGSIEVPELFALESYANVHHLVSTVSGRLNAESDAFMAMAHCFPGGSITGAPKRRAMEIIDECETQPRGPYCGSVCYFSANGHADSNIAIRSLLAHQGQIHCWGGGGIVADSIAEAEYQESLTKVALLMRTLEMQN